MNVMSGPGVVPVCAKAGVGLRQGGAREEMTAGAKQLSANPNKMADITKAEQ